MEHGKQPVKIRAPFRVSHVDEPRYGRFYFLEAFAIVRTLTLDKERPIVTVKPPTVRVTSKTFRWDYRIIGNLELTAPENVKEC